ncbi:MAG: hypothetical protein Q9187_004377 [Circinaria calcarea]
MILSPTRELAHQISAHLTDLCSNTIFTSPRIVTLTGGLSLQKQQRLLSNADIIVGTPGRLWETISTGQSLLTWLRQIKYLVVDEADRLLSEGHFKEVEEILNSLDREDEEAGDSDKEEKRDLTGKGQRQTLVFSATFQKELQRKLAGKSKSSGGDIMGEQESMEYLLEKLNFREEKPKFIDVNPASQMASGLREGIIECAGLEKDLYLYALLLHQPNTRTLIFTNSISAVRRLTPFLQSLNIPAHALHSQMPQKARLRSVERFSSPSHPGSILIATDVAARGLDIPSVQLVVHYHLPRAADMYVHRSGRTARAEKSGSSILLCAPEEALGVRRLVAKVHARNTVREDDKSKKSFMRTIELDRRIVARLKPRVTLAKKISDASMAKEKKGHEDNWLKAAAADLGVEYDSEDFAAHGGSKKGRGSGRMKAEKDARDLSKGELAALRMELKALLSQRVNVGVSERYLSAGGVDVEELLSEGSRGEFLGKGAEADGLDPEPSSLRFSPQPSPRQQEANGSRADAAATTDSDIAVIGMACRVAGANSPSELWDLLASSRDVQSEITRFNIKGYYHPEGGPRKGLTNVKNAYMMDDEKIDRFDHGFFHTTPVEAIAMDPQQRMLLEIAYETIENAGIPMEEFVGTDSAVYAGMDSCDYHSVLARDIDATPRYLATGTAGCMAANRLSYFFDLSGPSLAVDTACSSTMAALHQAVCTLRRGESSMALVCGAKHIFNPDMFIPSSELGFLSPSGRCRSFDAAGDGYGRGEGVLALLLKPLKQAIGDRDPIRAIIKGTRLNQDGRTQGITMPSAVAQKQNMESLYHQLGLSPNDIQYIEAHGTGTAAGDPLEFSAINAVFGQCQREEKLVVGSIKSSIGHLESAAALAGIIKTIECLERGQIPAQMHFGTPNPKINFENVTIPINMMEWPTFQGGIRRAAVNTFGAGGTNGHCVLEAFSRAPSETFELRRPLLFKVAAADTSALRRLALKYADYVEAHNPDLYDLAYTLLSRRSNLKESQFLTATSHKELVQKLRAETRKTYTVASEPVMRVVFLFTGQGAQWAQMGKLLIDQSPIFKAVVSECEEILASLPDKPSWSIIEELSKTGDSSNVYQSAFSQPLCTALQLGLVVLWESWGLVPSTVIGHSSGEIAAAYTAGFISLRDAIITAYYRGLYISDIASEASAWPKGSMCAIGLSVEDTRKRLTEYEGRVQLAAVNSPSSCTLSGKKDAIEEIVGICAKEGTFCRELRVDMAYHSHYMLPVAPRYVKALKDAHVVPSKTAAACDMFSSVTGQQLSQEDCSIQYWKQNLVSTVQFFPALSECMARHPESSVIVEIGPHPALKGPTQESLRTLGKDSVDYFHSCLRGRNDWETLLDTAGSMIAHGVPLKTSNINASEVADGHQSKREYGNVLTNIPGYQWDHSTSFWAESRISSNLRYRQFPRHQLLGSRSLGDIPSCPSWRNLLMLKEVSWLSQIKIKGATAMPPTVFILMALEATRQLRASSKPDTSSIHLSEITFDRPLELALFSDIDTTVELHFNARQVDESNQFRFEIFSARVKNENNSIRHCSGTLGWNTDIPKKSPLAKHAMHHDPLLLEKSRVLGQEVSPSISALKMSAEGSTGIFESSTDYHENYCMDPVILDAILHLPPISLQGSNLPAIHGVLSIRSITLYVTEAHYLRRGQFATKIRPVHSYGSNSSIEIFHHEWLMLLSDVHYRVDRLVIQKPMLNSLFFKPVILPDISKLSASRPMSLADCLHMVTHKWPMSDIGVAQASSRAIQSILDVLLGYRPEERPRFRSTQVVGEAGELTSDRIRFVQAFDEGAHFHILFTGESVGTEQASKHTLPNGLLCTPGVDKTEEIKLTKSFKLICEVTAIDQGVWALWRKAEKSVESHLSRKVKIFACPDQGISSIDFLPYAELISLKPAPVEEFCERVEEEKYDAVVFDCIEKSIITTWSGDEFVPWLQTLLKSCTSVIWVTQQARNSPYNNIAGTLLRTLQSEQPSLRVTWLVFGDSTAGNFIQATIRSAYIAMLDGENEISIVAKDSRLEVIRYLPDDELSAATGVIPPRKVTDTIVGKHYKLALSAPRKLEIFSHVPDSLQTAEVGKVYVNVEASVVDLDDISAFYGASKRQAQLGLGRFFAGRVISENNTTFPGGSLVVGWHPEAHRNQLEVSLKCLLTDDGVDTSATVVADFAAVATALCVVDGIARVRKGESFKVKTAGILAEALFNTCRAYGATVLDDQSDGAADFTVTVSKLDGLLVNGLPVELDKYLRSDHGVEVITRAWEKRQRSTSRLRILDIADYQQAFLEEPMDPYSTVLIHSKLEKIKDHAITYKKATQLFSSDGAYIIIGGLGGLGRYVCSWMVENGAKRLITISRNGVSSWKAQETFAAINASDALLEVMKADACDREAVANILNQIRQEGPITGVINMAMLLGDAPLANMAGWQWDRALRLKVDSSWILHEETLNDPLEFFIVFSSIASVLGNRNQGGYNVGNTFLNALASYRRSLGLTAVSIALGAMSKFFPFSLLCTAFEPFKLRCITADVGVLHELGKGDLLQTLSRSGLSSLGKKDFAKIMEAAVMESHRTSERSLILTGLQMYERVDGKLVGSQDQTQLYWTELPEFGHLQSHRLSSVKGEKCNSQLSLREQIQGLNKGDTHGTVTEAFLAFLSQLLGFESSIFNPGSSLAVYGLDSLSAVSCQYWFYRGLS